MLFCAHGRPWHKFVPLQPKLRLLGSIITHYISQLFVSQCRSTPFLFPKLAFTALSLPVSCFLPADDGKFSEATAVLLTWIDRGEVNRRTANQFYSMVQSANGHVRRLMSEKAQHEEEMELAKERFKTAMVAILTECKPRLPPRRPATPFRLCRDAILGPADREPSSSSPPSNASCSRFVNLVSRHLVTAYDHGFDSVDPPF